MGEVAPPPPVTPPGTGGPGTGTVAHATPAPQAAGEVTLERLPERLTRLARPVVLTGMPAGETTDGLVRLRTPLGEIVVRPALPLPTDRPVTLQIPAGSPPVRAQAFIAAQGPAPQAPPPQLPDIAAPPPQAARTAPPPAAQGAAGPAPPQPALKAGTVVPATIVASATPAAPERAAQPPVPAPPAPAAIPRAAASAAAAYGAHAPAFPAPAAVPTAPGTQGPQATLPPGPTPASASAPAPVPPSTPPSSGTPQAPPAAEPPAAAGRGPEPMRPAAMAAPAASLPASGLRQGAPVELHVLRLPDAGRVPAHPSPAAPVTPAPPPGPGLQAVVTGTAPGGQTILASGNGPLVVQARVALPPGTTVAISLPAVPPLTAAFDPLHGIGWPNLRHALDVLTQADPASARALMSALLPQAGPRLASAIAHFTGVVRQGGDTRRWVGERAAQAVESADRKALSALDEDFQSLGRQAAEPLPGDWRAYSLPFSDGQAITRIQLFVRRSGDDDEAEGTDRSGGKARRFLIDVDLSALGRMQFDGLMRDKRLDLILRTRTPLPAEMRQDIQNLFTVTLDALGLAGSASFQAGGEGWVVVPPPPSPSGGGAGGERGLIA